LIASALLIYSIVEVDSTALSASFGVAESELLSNELE